jgi:RND family efflux transporter MFP subunit
LPHAGPRTLTVRLDVLMSEETNTRRRDLIVGLLLGATVTVVLLYTAYHVTHTVQKDARLVRLPIPVQTVPATVKVLHATIGASGTIQPSMPVTMTAKVVSGVLKVPVDLGTVVKRGDLLVELDQRLFKTNLEAARVSHEHARKQLQRMLALMRRDFASAVDVEKARTEEAVTRDAVVRAEIDLANTRVVSPVPAVVLEREINPGEITKIDQDLVELGVLDPVMMVAQVPEDKIGAVYLGMRGVVGTDAFPGMNFTGPIAKIDSQVNDITRTFAAYARLDNHDLRLKKGVTGYARLESTRMALTIPSTAVMNPVGDRATVFVVGKDSKAHMREIRQGLAVEGMTEVLGGIEEGDQVVATGQFDLRDNEPVRANHFAPWNEHTWK